LLKGTFFNHYFTQYNETDYEKPDSRSVA
jgi:hypothetical protein